MWEGPAKFGADRFQISCVFAFFQLRDHVLVFRSNGCIFVSHIFMYPARIVRRSFLQVRMFVVYEFNESMNDHSFFVFFFFVVVVVVFLKFLFLCLFYFQKFD